jgi:hypothetical protein
MQKTKWAGVAGVHYTMDGVRGRGRGREEGKGEGTSLQKLAEYHSAAGFVLKAAAALDAADEDDASSPFASASPGCSHVGEGKFIAPQALHLCKNEITLRLQWNKRNRKKHAASNNGTKRER